jgi:serine/threonine-protein kinase HipA
LITTRFDRRWVGVDADSVDSRRFKPAKGIWIARLPQEDFCQATGCPPTKKYESDGGPSIETGLSLLVNSAAAEYDRTVFVLAQLAFWLLAATDGHGKNFSLHHLAGGAYGMTPLYDVLSAWPIIGSRANQLPLQKAKLAMALRGKSAHYRLNEIRTRHWRELAQRTAVPGLWQQMISLVERAAPAIERLTDTLPASFPEKVAKKIGDGVTGQVRTFLDDVA